MATIPARASGLPEVVESLRGQVDHLHVCLNYPAGADVPAALDARWITVRSTPGADLGCTARIWMAAEFPRGYVLPVDDDIVYLDGYTQRLVDAVEEYERRALVSLHGGVLPARVDDFTRQRQRHDFEDAVPADQAANIVGVGASAWHTDTLRVSLSDFPSINQDDLWLATKCLREHIPMVVLGRTRKLCRGIYYKDGLWNRERTEPGFSDELTHRAREVAWRVLMLPRRPGVSFLLYLPEYDPDVAASWTALVVRIANHRPAEGIVVIGRGSLARARHDLPTRSSGVAFKVIHSMSPGSPGRAVDVALGACRFDTVFLARHPLPGDDVAVELLERVDQIASAAAQSADGGEVAALAFDRRWAHAVGGVPRLTTFDEASRALLARLAAAGGHEPDSPAFDTGIRIAALDRAFADPSLDD